MLLQKNFKFSWTTTVLWAKEYSYLKQDRSAASLTLCLCACVRMLVFWFYYCWSYQRNMHRRI